MSGTKLIGNKKMSITDKINIYNKPKKVYIPLINQNDTDITLLVKKDDYVFKGTIIGRRKGNFKIPIHSSVSGKVVDIVEKTYLNGNKVKCVVIENDFKEKIEKEIGTTKDINKFSKQEFIQTIQELGIVGMGGSGFPTYIKYDTDKKIKTLIVNAVECEPYITADFMMIKTHPEEILETIDAMLEINQIDEAIIAIKNTNIVLKEILDNYLGTYLNIKVRLVKNIYPAGWEKRLIEEIKHVTYKNLPIEKNIVVNNVSTIYAIYEALKYHLPLTERIITFSGDMFKNPQNVLVKIGTPIDEVVAFIGGCKRQKEIYFIAGGPMMGNSLPTNELVVTPNLNCVLILKKNKEEKETTCLRCSRCVNICPSKLCPVLVKDYIDDEEMLEKLEVNKCVECGLCTYICPAKIDVRSYLREAKTKLREKR